MVSLQVEELEPRRLLRGAGFSPQQPSGQPPAEGPCPAPSAARAPLTDSTASHAARLESSPPHSTGSVSPPASRDDGGGRANAPGVSSSVAQTSVTTAADVVIVVRFTVPTSSAANTDGDRTQASEPRAASSDPATAAAAVAKLSADPAVPPAAPPIENALAIPRFHGDGQNPYAAALAVGWSPAAVVPGPRGFGPDALAVWPGVGAASEHGGLSGIPETPLRPGPPDLYPSAGQRTGETAEVPSPRGFGVLDFLPPLPLSAVERALQQFLDRLEQAHQNLDEDRGAGGLWPWLVAGVAAGAACEITRRQLRRRAQTPLMG